MRKRDELSHPESCLNKAADEELLFVLLGRDPAAPSAIRHWCRMRVELGLNAIGDPKIQDALACADAMDDTG